MLIILKTGRRDRVASAVFNRHFGAQLFEYLSSDSDSMQRLVLALVNCFTRTAVMEDSITRRMLPPIQLSEAETPTC